MLARAAEGQLRVQACVESDRSCCNGHQPAHVPQWSVPLCTTTHAHTHLWTRAPRRIVICSTTRTSPHGCAHLHCLELLHLHAPLMFMRNAPQSRALLACLLGTLECGLVKEAELSHAGRNLP